MSPGAELLAQDSLKQQTGRISFNTVKALEVTFINQNKFQSYVDSMKAYGIQSLRLIGSWRIKCLKCSSEGNLLDYNTTLSSSGYDFSSYFRRLDYAINKAKLKVVLSFNFAGKFDSDSVRFGSQKVLPAFLGPDDVMQYRDASGKDVVYLNQSGGSLKVPRFEKPTVRKIMLDFVTAVVTQFRARYGDNIMYYQFTLGAAEEAEYLVIPYPGFCDTSPDAATAFREWLQGRYSTPHAVSEAWGHSPPFTDYNQIQILDGQPPPKKGQAPVAYLDFMAYREWSLGKMLGEIRDRVHAAGGKVSVSYGSVWDAASCTRGTYTFGKQIQGADLVVINDAPAYDHSFSSDYVRTNSSGIPFGSMIDSPCYLGCESGSTSQCCNPATFPQNINVAFGINRMNDQTSISFQRGATLVGLSNWEMFPKAFSYFAPGITNLVNLAGEGVTFPVAQDTMKISLRQLYVHHHDQSYTDQLIASYRNLGGDKHPVAVLLIYDL